MTDSATRFIFRDTDVRGNLVRLTDSYRDINALHDYPPAARALLGEFLVAALLLSDTVKFEGRLVLQASGAGPIRVVMAEATHDGATRGLIRLDDGAVFDPTLTLDTALAGGTLAVTIEPAAGQRYQSIVPLVGATLADCLERYFAQSEQLPTIVRLAADDSVAAGMLVQQLPMQLERDAGVRFERWRTISLLSATLSAAEMLREQARTILTRLFAGEQVALLEERPVRFRCSCSEQRMAGALVSLGEEELQALFAEDPEIELVCEFCGAVYRFDAVSLTDRAAGGLPPH